MRVGRCNVSSEIVDYASKKGVRIGVENREHYEAVPSEREFEDFLRVLDSPSVGYWHDFGHAQIKQNMALLDHADWLDHIGQSGPWLPCARCQMAFQRSLPAIHG